MSKASSIVNLGDISKPGTVLIENISDALGGYCKPYQIIRVAKAEAEAEIIRAQAQIEVTDLQRRALTRFIAEEANKQENIETITEQAIPQLEDSSKPEEMENDWVANFFDKCRIVSDGEMQRLWSQVLAGEANAPGTFSKRTVNFLGSLDKADARLFTALCCFAWDVGHLIPLIYDVEACIYNNAGIIFPNLTHLDDIGLVSFQPLSGLVQRRLAKRTTLYYHGYTMIMEFKQEQDNELPIGHVLLTNVGAQLARICGSNPVQGFMDYVVQRWMKEGLVLSSPYPRNL